MRISFRRFSTLSSVSIIVSTILPSLSSLFATEIPAKYHTTIDKGLKWLAANQFKDGHWASVGSVGRWTIPMTSLSGMTFLMEGSTVRSGKYCDAIRRARDWLLRRQHANGLISVRIGREEEEGFSCMHGHGFATLFLSCLLGEEEDAKQRVQLSETVEKACRFIRNAQTSRGGWGYHAALDQPGGQNDEGSVTITQIQALRAARNAGVVVPAEAIQLGIRYLHDSTNSAGGIIYSLGLAGGAAAAGEGRPMLTAAAVACGFNAGDYNSPDVKHWLRFCQKTIPCRQIGRMGHDEYLHYYYAQVLYVLGEDRWRRLFPDDKPAEELTWSRYRAAHFDEICSKQTPSGCWPSGVQGGIGPVFATACYLSILQLDKAALPIYQR